MLTTEHSKGALRGPMRKLAIGETLVEATGYRPSLLRCCPRVEALFFPIPLCPLRSEPDEHAKGYGAYHRQLPRARDAPERAFGPPA